MIDIISKKSLMNTPYELQEQMNIGLACIHGIKPKMFYVKGHSCVRLIVE